MIRIQPLFAALTIATAITFGGCGLARMAEVREQLEGAGRRLTADLKLCEDLHPDRLKKPATPRVTCVNNAALLFHETRQRLVGNSEIDLVRLMAARTAVAAERYDAGRLTPAEFNAELAAAMSDHESQRTNRRNSAAMVAAARDQAAAAQDQAAAVNRPVSCQQIGHMVQCF